MSVHRHLADLVTRLFPGQAREDALERLVERTLRERDVARGKLWRAERAMEAAVVLTDIQQGQRDEALARAEKAEAALAKIHGSALWWSVIVDAAHLETPTTESEIAMAYLAGEVANHARAELAKLGIDPNGQREEVTATFARLFDEASAREQARDDETRAELTSAAEETAPANDCGDCNGSGQIDNPNDPGHPCSTCDGNGKLCGWCSEAYGDDHVCTPETPTHDEAHAAGSARMEAARDELIAAIEVTAAAVLCEVCDEPVDPNDPDRATLIDDDGTTETCGTCVRNRRICNAMRVALGIDPPTAAEREAAFIEAITPGPPPYIPTADEVRIAGEAFEDAGEWISIPPVVSPASAAAIEDIKAAGLVKLKGMSLMDCFRGSGLDVDIAINALANEGAVLVDTTTPAHRALATCDVISCRVHARREGDPS